MSRPILAWHFLRDDRTLQFEHNKRENVKVRVGQTLRYKGELSLCHRGLHASVRLIDALKYAPGATICRVECGGEILRGDDKICAETRKVLWWIDGTRLLHEFACDVAESALAKAKNRDPRSVAAIKAKRDWLAGKITDEELEAARSAARSAALSAESAESAARSAAWSALSAAWSAGAESAAWSALSAESAAWSARSAARSALSAAWSALSAAWSAESAAWSALSAESAAEAEQNKLLTRRVLAARKAGGQ